jgi:hypothetical protein
MNQVEEIDKKISLLAESTTASGTSSYADVIVSTLHALDDCILSAINHSFSIQKSPSSFSLPPDVVIDNLSAYLSVELECILTLADRVTGIDKKIEALSLEVREYAALRMEALVNDLNRSISQLETDKQEDISSIALLGANLDSTFSLLSIGQGGKILISTDLIGVLKISSEDIAVVVSALKMASAPFPDVLNKLSSQQLKPRNIPVKSSISFDARASSPHNSLKPAISTLPKKVIEFTPLGSISSDQFKTSVKRTDGQNLSTLSSLKSIKGSLLLPGK